MTTPNTIPHDPLKRLQQAIRCHQTGQLDAAEEGYAGCLNETVVRLPALFYGGVLALQRGDLPNALDRLGTLSGLDPGRPEVWYHLGLVHARSAQGEHAETCYRKAIALRPDFVEAHNNLGNLLRESGRPHEAVAVFRQAERLSPGNHQVLLNLGDTLLDAGDAAQAVAVLLQAAACAPAGNTEGLASLGAAYHELEQLDKALDAYRKALRWAPKNAGILANIARAELENGNVKDSRAIYRQLTRRSDGAHLGFRLATLIPAIPDNEAEITELRAAIANDLAALRANPPVIKDPYRQIGEVPFYLSYHGRKDDRELMDSLAQAYLRACPSLAYTSPHCAESKSTAAWRRIGFVSRFFHHHSVGKTMAGIISGMARAGFEVHVLSLPPVTRDDHLRAIAASAHRHHELPDDLVLAREAIGALKLDILVFADIGMEPLSYFLAFSRLAPVQCVTWGHPVTTGIPNIDYYLSHADLETPDSQSLYSEKLIPIRGGAIYPDYPRPSLPNPCKTRAQFGLPESRPLFICPQSAFKLMPGFDEHLGAILDAVPNSTLLVPKPRLAWMSARLLGRWQKTIKNAEKRIRFFPHTSLPEFCNLVALADVLLDPFPVGGGVTTFDSLLTGTPIVTLAGTHMRGRFAGACLHQMGLSDWVSSSPERYVERAVALAGDEESRTAARHTLASAASDWLYENRTSLSAIEHFFSTVTGPNHHHAAVTIADSTC